MNTLLDLILKGGHAERINAKMVQLEARKAEVERALADAEEPPPLLHPEMATFYGDQVAALHVALGDEDGVPLRYKEAIHSEHRLKLSLADGVHIVEMHVLDRTRRGETLAASFPAAQSTVVSVVPYFRWGGVPEIAGQIAGRTIVGAA